MLIGQKTIGTIAYMGGVMALPEPFVWSWTQMIQFNNEVFENDTERLHYTRATVSYHSFARNSLVDQMQGEFLLMLDTDHAFEPDLLWRMLNKMDLYNIDVLVAPYLYKSEPYPPVLYGWDKKKKAKYIIGDWDRTNNPNVMRVWGGGAGCLLVRKSVFQKIKKKLKCTPFDIMVQDSSPLSEDHSFFQRCYQLRIPVYATLDLESPHLIYKKLSIFKDYRPKDQKTDRVEDWIGRNDKGNDLLTKPQKSPINK